MKRVATLANKAEDTLGFYKTPKKDRTIDDAVFVDLRHIMTPQYSGMTPQQSS